MTWVKICGTTNLQDAQSSVAAGASALGFIFAASPRRVDAEAAAKIISALHGEVEAVGVFVNETPERVAAIAERAALTGVQLHGDEPPEILAEFRCALGDRKIIKTLSARALEGGEIKLDAYLAARDSVDAILLDSGSAQQRGGTGVSFDWESALPFAEEIRRTMPLIVAGGLSSDNVVQAIERFEPWGVDVATGVEDSPGKKDEAKLREFVAAVRQAPISVRQRE